MKRLPLSYLPILLLCFAPLFLGSTCGNRTLDPEGVYAGDKILFTADQTIANSFDTLHGFVSWEHANRAVLASVPEIKESADFVRVNAKAWRDAVVAARDAYASVPNETNRVTLARALAVVRSALASAIAHQQQNPVRNLP